MNLLFVSNLYPPIVFGGYEILASQVAEVLRSRGHEIFVQTSDFRADECPADRWISRDLELTTAFPLPGQDTVTPDFSLGALNRVARRNRRRTHRLLRRLPDLYSNGSGPDLVFAWNLNRMTLGPLFAAKDESLPGFWTLNDLHPRQFWVEQKSDTFRRMGRQIAEKFFLPLATMRRLPDLRTTAISEALKRQLLENGVPVDGAEVLYQGIPIDRFPYRPLSRQPQDALRLLYVGQLSEAKGVHTILDALRIVPLPLQSRFKLTVVGDGVAAYERRLQDAADEVGCDVRFAGRLPHDRIAAQHNEHHVLVFPSEWEEPFGLAHLEAMASGCAVVSTATGGTAELVRDRRNSLVFDTADAGALAGCLVQLLEDETLRQTIISTAREEVRQRFTLEAYADRLEQFLGIGREGEHLAKVA